MIDFSKFNSAKAPYIPPANTLAPTQAIDPNEITVTRGPAFQSPVAQQEAIIVAANDPLSPSADMDLSQTPLIGPTAGDIMGESKKLPAGANPSGQNGSGGFIGALTRLVLGGTGDESTLDKSTQAAKSKKRSSAGDASASFANDSESASERYMQAPGTGGSSFGQTIQGLGSILKGLV